MAYKFINKRYRLERVSLISINQFGLFINLEVGHLYCYSLQLSNIYLQTLVTCQQRPVKTIDQLYRLGVSLLNPPQGVSLESHLHQLHLLPFSPQYLQCSCNEKLLDWNDHAFLLGRLKEHRQAMETKIKNTRS